VRCEVCGRRIYGKPFKAIIEGAKLTVCGKCAEHGKIVREKRKAKTILPGKKPSIKPSSLKPKSRSIPQLPLESSLELVENFDTKIKRAREKQGLSQEDLGRKTNEKVSVLKKLETGKMTPDNKVAIKLEHALKIKLLVPASEKAIPQPKIPQPPSQKLTLGDLIKLDNEKKGEKTQRKQS
jgi:putative transcription factor